jgi:hypothetical protein
MESRVRIRERGAALDRAESPTAAGSVRRARWYATTMSKTSPADAMNSEEVSSRSSDHGRDGSTTDELLPMPSRSQRTVA